MLGLRRSSLAALLWLAVTVTCLGGITNATTAVKGSAEAAHQLNDENFDEKTAKGLWLVEHYSPGCGHCRMFAPTYEKLAIAKKSYEATRGFHIAQINCQAQGDLCNQHDIKYYPQIKLYENGVELEIYSGDRDFSVLSSYIDDQSTRFIRSLGSAQEVMGSPRGMEVNTEGLVAELDAKTLPEMVERGPTFVKFYAPWCGHCKKLAPTWAQLATNAKGKVNVAEVNCDKHGALCKKQGIKGYPTLVMFSHGRSKEFNGKRKLEDMEAYMNKAAQESQIERIDAKDASALEKKHEVYFVFLQTFSSPDSDMATLKQAINAQLESPPVYESRDPDLFHATGVDPIHGSALLCFKDHSSSPVAALRFSSSEGSVPTDTVTNFITANGQPSVIELSSANFQEIMKSPSRALIVLVALKKSGRKEGELEAELEQLKVISRAWRRGGRAFVQPVWFVWIDGEKWGKWLKRSYGIDKNSLPAVVLADPPLSEYYDTTLEKQPMKFEGASIFSTLEGCFQHFLQPKFTESALERGSRSIGEYMTVVTDAMVGHPILAIIVIAGMLGGTVFAVSSCIAWDVQRGGNNRLD